MTAAPMMERIAETSPRFKARMAGVLYFFSLLTAALSETFVHGALNYAGGYIAILGMAAVTLICYDIFRPVNRGLSLIAASFAFVGLAFETLRLQPQGLNIALVFHGCYCILIGYLIFKSTFFPRMLGALSACRFKLADLSVEPARQPSVPLQSCLRPSWRCVAVPVAAGDGRERSTMEGAGRRSRAVVTSHAFLFP
jgi:Domain of unknown function (DUF4386)